MRDAFGMRTTMDVDDDVLLAVKGLAAQRRVSAGRVFSDLVRRALAPRRASGDRNGVPLFPRTSPAKVVTLDLVNRLRDGSP
jgi:hypothetical protein